MNRKAAIWSVLLLPLAACLAQAFAQEKSGGAAAVIANYRHWTHVKSMVIHDPSHPLFGPFGGIHLVYVNAKGAGAVKKSGPYLDGTVFVFDLLEPKLENGAYVEGRRKVLALMTKDAKKFASTGGWQFLAFAGGDPEKQVVKDAARECFACHEPQKSKDYVYSVWRP